MSEFQNMRALRSRAKSKFDRAVVDLQEQESRSADIAMAPSAAPTDMVQLIEAATKIVEMHTAHLTTLNDANDKRRETA
jgi:hypothetical protein